MIPFMQLVRASGTLRVGRVRSQEKPFMNIKILSGCLFALASVAPVYADDVDIEDLAARTGLSERQVRMVLGPRTPYAEYRTSYDMAERRVADALLEDSLHPAVTVGEINTTPAPATTISETTTTTTYPASESTMSNSTQFESDIYDADDVDSSTSDDEYDNDDVGDND